MNILFTDTGWSQYTEWREQDKKTIKRINQLLKNIDRDGANRLVYEISGNQIIVKSCKGHYED